MKKLLLVLTTVMLAACGSAEPEKSETEQVEMQVTDKQRQELVNYLKSDQEPSIKDAMFDTDKQLKIAVDDDGTSRDGFAEYVCTTIDERFDSKGYMVTVYDANKIMQGEWKRLGQHLCKSKV